MKKGISLVSLTIVIIIMSILAGIIIFTGFESREVAAINTFAVEILNIQTAVDDYYYRHEKYPVLSDYTLDAATIAIASVSQFDKEIIENNTINFKVIDLSLVGINDVEFGSGENNEVYVLSESTGKVYYLAGVEFEGITYYTLTAELMKILDIQQLNNVSTADIVVQDIIFTPSDIEYTNQPVIVQVKIPVTATINSITASGDKSVSTETTQRLYNVVTINETSTDKTGNYTIAVNYTYEGITKTAEYAVTNFDNTTPALSVTETENGNVKTIKITATDVSDIAIIKYAKEIVADKIYFENYGTNVNNAQFTIESDSWYTVYVQDKAGNSTMYNNMPEDWKANVVDIVDGVPIPKGFMASGATGENTKDGGLVIYQGTQVVTDQNVEKARRERNQYVWVPVSSEEFKTKFVRKTFDSSKLSNVLGTANKYWEVEIDETTNIPLSEQSNMSYISKETLAEVQAMYASVKKYEGFYVARYEAGIDTQRTSTNYKDAVGNIIFADKMYSVMGKIPYTYIPWSVSSNLSNDTGGAVEEARNVYVATDTSYGVVSTLIYGVQWDSILQWYLDTKAIESVTESDDYGNYSEHIIQPGDLNKGAMYAVYDTTTSALGVYKVTTTDTAKASGEPWCLTTGALKAAKINNIYDMAGNVMEWDMEGITTTHRIYRGGRFFTTEAISKTYLAHHSSNLQNVPNVNGFRISLYIK